MEGPNILWNIWFFFLFQFVKYNNEIILLMYHFYLFSMSSSQITNFILFKLNSIFYSKCVFILWKAVNWFVSTKQSPHTWKCLIYTQRNCSIHILHIKRMWKSRIYSDWSSDIHSLNTHTYWNLENSKHVQVFIYATWQSVYDSLSERTEYIFLYNDRRKYIVQP